MSSEAAAYFTNGLTDASDVYEAVSERDSSRRETVADISSAEPSDEQLLSQVGLGSRDALGLLFRRHAGAVWGVGWGGGGGGGGGGGLRQEVFLYLSERSQHFDAQKGSGV